MFYCKKELCQQTTKQTVLYHNKCKRSKQSCSGTKTNPRVLEVRSSPSHCATEALVEVLWTFLGTWSSTKGKSRPLNPWNAVKTPTLETLLQY